MGSILLLPPPPSPTPTPRRWEHLPWAQPAALLQASCLRPLQAALITAGWAPEARAQVRAQVGRLQAIGDLSQSASG